MLYGAFTFTVVWPETVAPVAVVQRIANVVDVVSGDVVALPSVTLAPI